ncbi:MAG: HD domain-containing protein [Candidatus Velthaea sp.]
MNFPTDRFETALWYAAAIHRKQRRKASATSYAREPNTPVPYVGHLLGTASIVIDAGGDEDESIAALLHDAAEDQGGEERLTDIRARFGDRVAEIVEGCSDSLTASPQKKTPWRERKERYIAHLATSADRSIYLVSAADKCHNARATARDLAFAADPAHVWQMFNADPASTLWYYTRLAETYAKGPIDGRRDLIVSDLGIALREMLAYATVDDANLAPIEAELPF